MHLISWALQRRRLRYRYRQSREIPCMEEVYRQVGHQTVEAQEAEVEDHLDRRDRHHHRRVSHQDMQQMEAMVRVHICTEWIQNYSNDQ